jgi:uncharacterized membrane protein YphA (DoxX/SURF4 family)
MKRVLTNKHFLLLLRITIGYIFIYAGAIKISNSEAFAISISNYRLLPVSTLNFFAIFQGCFWQLATGD